MHFVPVLTCEVCAALIATALTTAVASIATFVRGSRRPTDRVLYAVPAAFDTVIGSSTREPCGSTSDVPAVSFCAGAA